MANILNKKLLEWYDADFRPLPWKKTKDPYKIWLSEIILQQTRVAQGTPYYLKFVKNFPAVKDLADAPLEKVLKLWEGLGYYSRARNLHFAAKTVVNDLNGEFPNNYKDLLKLKGIGEYTASAIASFAFDEPTAVVDGNVYRVLSRIFGISEAIDTPNGKKLFKTLAQKELNKQNPADYNQAIMNFGALMCLPKNPKCSSCPFQNDCIAFQKNTIDLYPVKSKKIIKKNRFFNYYIFYDNENTIIRQRDQNDIWKMLFEFPMIESKEKLIIKIKQSDVFKIDSLLKESAEIVPSQIFKQVLTHQNIRAQFILVKFDSLKSMELEEKWTLIHRNELNQFAFPRIINTFFEETNHIF